MVMLYSQGLPCHLYFDLEFNKKANADKNGDEMVDLLIVAVFDTLLQKYSLEGSHDWIVELDSSTEGMVIVAFFNTWSHALGFMSKLHMHPIYLHS